MIQSQNESFVWDTQLANGCWVSQASFCPANWKSTRASVKSTWYFEYYFHDPAFKDDPKLKYGKRIRVKSGINHLTTLQEKQEAMKLLFNNEKQLLLSGYNPITKAKTYTQPVRHEELTEDSPIREIFLICLKKKWKDYADRDVKIDVFSYVKRLYKSARQLGLDKKRTADFKRKDLLNILDNIKLSDSSFNHCLGYITPIFEKMVLYEFLEYNPMTLIPRREIIKKKRVGLTADERQRIAEHLKTADFRFYLFVHIFFYSGGRMKELTRLKIRDINLKTQTIDAAVLKGKAKEVSKVITDDALPYWDAYLNLYVDMPSDYYVFSHQRAGFGKSEIAPNNIPMDRRILTRRWFKLVKKQLGIDKDMYLLKHAFSSEISKVSQHMAADFNSHTDTTMVERHYDLMSDERKQNARKTIAVDFAKGLKIKKPA